MIHLVGNWYLDADPCNFIIGEKYVANEKNKDNEPIQVERLKNQKYYTYISDALEAIVKMKLRSAIEKKEVTDIKALADLFVAFNNEVIDRYKGVEKELEEMGKVKPSPSTVKKARKALGAM